MLRPPFNATLAGIFLLALAGCAVNPATGERQLSFIGEGREIEMGREADPQIVASLGLYPDSSVQRYVRALGERLAAASERPDLPWTFRVLDDATVNAFALPGGFIYVTRGILTHFNSEAQLAGVLGHEIGHVTARHSVNQISRQQLGQVALGVGMILSSDVRAVGDVAGAGLQVLSLKFSRDDETQADELGIRYMTRLDYDPRELAGVMRMLERTSELGSQEGRAPEWLSTHPDPGNRVVRIGEIVDASGMDLTGSKVDGPAFLGEIDGMVFGHNPREGFFEGSLFRHPDLEFQLSFPDGWAKQNAKTAVQAVSPGQDAVMLLTLGEGSPTAALAEFGADGEITLGRTRGESVNGLPAARAAFRARTDQGNLEGEVLFVARGETTFRVLGYASAQRWSDYAGVVSASLGSFQRETDPETLAVRPARLELVTVPEPLTLEAFTERFPSTVDIQVISLINQVEPGESFARGVLAKRIRGGR